jgi:hypothetical protein
VRAVGLWPQSGKLNTGRVLFRFGLSWGILVNGGGFVLSRQDRSGNTVFRGDAKGAAAMAKQGTSSRNTLTRFSRELLAFQDDLHALNARIAFVLTALTRLAESQDPLDPRSAAGATDCASSLNSEMQALEQRLGHLRKAIVSGHRTQ